MFIIISTDEGPVLRIERFAIINLRGVSTNKNVIIHLCRLIKKKWDTLMNSQSNKYNFLWHKIKSFN